MKPVSFVLLILVAWTIFQIKELTFFQNESKRTHDAPRLASIETKDMVDGTMPPELNAFLSRKDLNFGKIAPMLQSKVTPTVIQEPLTIDSSSRGFAIDTGTAPWLTNRGKAVEVVYFSSTNMQGTESDTKWIGKKSQIDDNPSLISFSLPFTSQKPDTVIFEIVFRATGHTVIELRSGQSVLKIYERDESNAFHMGGTARLAPETCSASSPLGTGPHVLVVTVRSGINRPAVFWAQGTVGGGVAGNLSL